MAAQHPTQVQDNQLDDVLQTIKSFLTNPTTRDRIAQARNFGGWEVWLQVELAMYMQYMYNFHMIQREQRVFINEKLPIDLWAEPQSFAPAGAAGAILPFGIELKVEYNKEKGEPLNQRLVKDITQFYNGDRILKNDPYLGRVKPGTRVYCIGFTQKLDDCINGYSNLYNWFNGFNMSYWKLPGTVSGDMGGANNQYLVWWMWTYR